jgi:hypothetical protein
MQNNAQQNFIKNFLSVAPKHCDNCGAKYSESDFKIIKNSNSNTVLHLKCSFCNNAYMLNVMSPVNGMVGTQRSAINIDLDGGDELQKFAGQDSIKIDEAIDVHTLLGENTEKKSMMKLLGIQED